ncbi:nuclear transport factor 2 family protein [Winogradskyella maritima]|uniref:Nuclear transport factor 2 family protein n=1 Tax=Winogradskyella maritima TaxID=1517766 RepID=A0ABV8AIH8_9FLAO|nr:nuclear transport factor 2 family protein [Winogradskyella maritima]
MSEIITTFYNAFHQLDANTMVKQYHNDIIFEDPAFGRLQGKRSKAMWQMLCSSQKGKDFKIDYHSVTETTSEGSAIWEAYYTFSKTGRRVHNIIHASFTIEDGKITKHTDDFNLHKWASQAMGFKGKLLGGTGFFKRQLQKQTNAMLDTYITKTEKQPSTM